MIENPPHGSPRRKQTSSTSSGLITKFPLQTFLWRRRPFSQWPSYSRLLNKQSTLLFPLDLLSCKHKQLFTILPFVNQPRKQGDEIEASQSRDTTFFIFHKKWLSLSGTGELFEAVKFEKARNSCRPPVRKIFTPDIPKKICNNVRCKSLLLWKQHVLVHIFPNQSLYTHNASGLFYPSFIDFAENETQAWFLNIFLEIAHCIPLLTSPKLGWMDWILALRT